MPRIVTLAHSSIRHADWAERCAAASRGGFDAVGLHIAEYARLRRSGTSDEDLLAVLAEHDMVVSELEALPIFSDANVDAFVHLVATFGATRILVVPPFRVPVDHAEAASWLTALADRVAPLGASLALEFMPMTAVPDVVEAVDIVERASRGNIGLCLDAWHIFRGGGLASMVGLDPALVSTIQLCDGEIEPSVGDYLAASLHEREIPGDGEFDLRAIVDAADPDVPITVEVSDDDLDPLPPADVARLLRDSVDRFV